MRLTRNGLGGSNPLVSAHQDVLPTGDSVQIFSIAIVGAGPAGYFAAQALQNLQSDEIQFAIDIFERLPTPWGLVRSGVAPDHPKIKSVSKVFEKVATQPSTRLIANVNVGTDVTLDELEANYDAVVVAVGTPKGRSLGIPGEDMNNVISSADFVYWYNGHPNYKDIAVDLSGKRALVIGAGNVAMDVGRMLALDPHDLDATDTADYALKVFHQSTIRDVTIVARRGAENVAFTSPELRELPDLETTDVRIDRLDISKALDRAGNDPDKHVKANLDAMMAIAESESKNVERSLNFLFEHKPVEIRGSTKVESVVFDTPIGQREIPCDLLVTAIGYEPIGIAELAVEENRYTNKDGFIRGNLFVVGWAKRGPSGVIGTNKSDSTEVMKRLVESLNSPKEAKDLIPILIERGINVIEQSGWAKINEFELDRGVNEGRPRVKITEIDTMVEIATGN
jgi:ferredoxin/flavodoxin---NADP+ reductase